MKRNLQSTLLHAFVLVIMAVTLAACASTAPAANTPMEASSENAPAINIASAVNADGTCDAYNESPMLADRVAAGELPAVAERLPVHPVVVEPAEQIGMYGGEYLGIYSGSRLAEFRQYGYENLVRWNVEGTEVIPNIAESWEVSEDGTTYTFTLREGLRWSDGEPFTSADILFWWEQVETNPEINANPYGYFVVNGEPATVTAPDDLTVVFQFVAPNGLFLQNISASYGVRITQFAEHYLSQFSDKLNPDGVATMMEEDGQTEYGPWWVSRVGSYGNPAEYNDPDRPLMQPWVPVAPYVGEERFTFERNPYYFKVDPACNQLPYIDLLTWTLATDPEVRLLKTLDGEDYFSDRDISQPPNKAVFFDNQETGNYRFIDVINSDFNLMLLHMKFNHPETQQAEIMQNKDFRIGLSQAMDRQNVIDTVYIGQGEPHQQAPRPESPFYNETLAKQYTEYNVDLANEALDKVLPEKDAEGFRLAPDGERFVFTVLVNEGFRPDWVDAMGIVELNWEAVGIDTNLVIVTDDIWRQRIQEDDIDAYVWAGENGTGLLPLLAAGGYAPEAAWGWSAWESVNVKGQDAAAQGAEVVEPPAELQQQYQLVADLQQAVGIEAQTAIMNQILDLAADQFLTIGLSLPMGDYRVVNNQLLNVPNPVISGWLYPGPAPANYESFYLDPAYAK
ncbi:MAG TPA: ABC transporter substrate-binding protein [Caldilineaceae bacterium]|nr:ABC transporter substrate-binding protein [Caldilineaceae bacterium]